MKTKRFDHLFDIVMTVIFFLGLAIVAYPTISDWHNSKVQTQVITDYKQAVAEASDEELAQMKLSAQLYNEAVYAYQQGNAEKPSDESYSNILNADGGGIMGYLEIPTIDLELPIYHGTSDEVLQAAVGHSQTSSVPCGGQTTHALLLGHRGLPTATLFNHLDQLVVGDYFEVHVLDETLYYEVYNISIVESQELAKLRIKKDEDLVTLITCTPYGINSHRLLIHGRRIDAPDEQNVLISSEAQRIQPLYVAAAVGVVLWVILMAVLIATGVHNRRHGISKEERERRRRILSKYLR